MQNFVISLAAIYIGGCITASTLIAMFAYLFIVHFITICESRSQALPNAGVIVEQIEDERSVYTTLQEIFGDDFDFVSSFGRLQKYSISSKFESRFFWRIKGANYDAMEGHLTSDGRLRNISVRYYLGAKYWSRDDFWTECDEVLLVDVDLEKNEIEFWYIGPMGDEPKERAGSEIQYRSLHELGSWSDSSTIEDRYGLLCRVSAVLSLRNIPKPFRPGGAFAESSKGS